jgi:hypothetical protein
LAAGLIVLLVAFTELDAGLTALLAQPAVSVVKMINDEETIDTLCNTHLLVCVHARGIASRDEPMGYINFFIDCSPGRPAIDGDNLRR